MKRIKLFGNHSGYTEYISDDMARLDSLCPVHPEYEGDHPWGASCGK